MKTMPNSIQEEKYQWIKPWSWHNPTKKLRGEDLSDFVRRSIKMELARLSYLSEKEKKALGFKEVKPHECE